MSRIGKKPILLPEGTTCDIDQRNIRVKGPKGELAFNHAEGVTVAQNGNTLEVTRVSDQKRHRALHGLTRALVANMITGVSSGFSKQLDLVGIGYTAELKSPGVLLKLGYSHSILFQAPPGIDLEVTKRNTSITIRGIDKQLVGQVAAKIRALRKPEPYKGKGVRYSDEVVRRKAGKTVGGVEM